VLKAHGYKPAYTRKRVDEETVVKTANLSAESRASLDAIDLHFHDLRREAGSRWLDGSVPLHTIREQSRPFSFSASRVAVRAATRLAQSTGRSRARPRSR
jgi:hypothetical protein